MPEFFMTFARKNIFPEIWGARALPCPLSSTPMLFNTLCVIHPSFCWSNARPHASYMYSDPHNLLCDFCVDLNFSFTARLYHIF